MLIDSHVNLHHERFAADLPAVMARAAQARVGGMLTICDRLASIPAIEAIAAAYPNVWRSVGVHPHYAKEHPDIDGATLVALCGDDAVIGVGECGLDFHYEHSPRESQERVFRAHIDAARQTQLPLIIHARDADDAMQAMLEEEWAGGAFTPLLHCYTGGAALARAVVDMGGYVSFSGILTFRNAGDLRALAADIPIDRLIVETDCPYLAPVPHRGRRCEPAHVVDVANAIADLRGVDRAAFASRMTDNFFTLFRRAKLRDGAP
jgi:TatD DNase family protein